MLAVVALVAFFIFRPPPMVHETIPLTEAAAIAQNTDVAVLSDWQCTQTGQTEAYNNDGQSIENLSADDPFFGQDGHYAKGTPSAFQDNGDGTVTDSTTGLTWEQEPSPDNFTWTQAIVYCDELELAGHDDWRMPSAKELFSISNFSTGWPYVDTQYFSLTSERLTKHEQYWSNNYYVGETRVGGQSAAFGVNHVTGHIKAYPANRGGRIAGKHVRAVRGPRYGVNDFTDNGDGTITDNASGLIWMQNDSNETMDWKAALKFAEAFELADHNDWRLPNVKELQSIVDYNYSPTASQPEKIRPSIDPLFVCTKTTNEAGDSDYGYYWTSTSARFTTGKPFFFAWYVAFGRAVDDTGQDSHGAGAVRFDTKYEGGNLGEGGERFYNYVRLVRDAE